MDGEIWDEERWEAFLKENDRLIEYYMSVLFQFMSDNPPVGEEGSAVRRAWEVDLRAYLVSNGISPDDVLPHLSSGEWSEDESDDGILNASGPFLEFEDVEDAIHDVRNLPAYVSSQRLASRILRWSNSLPGRVKDSTLVQFCSHIMQIPSNLAKAHGIGYEIEMLGGNIACAKRALISANTALELLRELRTAEYMDGALYRQLYEESYEARNQVAIHVQELRRRFDLGID